MSKLKNIFIKVLTSVFLLSVVLLQNNAVSAAGSWDYVESMPVSELELSSTDSASTLLPTPQNLNFEISGPDTFTISWDPVNDADSYSLEVDGASVIDNITSTSYTIGNLMPGAHSFRIKAFSTLSESDWSSSISTKPAVPTNLTAQYNGSCVEISWDSNLAITQYIVEVDGDETWVNGTNFGFNNASYPGPYSIRVRAIGNWTASDWTEYVYVSTFPLLTPTNIMATAYPTQINLSWNTVDGADSYSLELDGTSVINNITTNSYIVSGLTYGTQHSYRIKANNICDESEWSSPVYISTPSISLPIPENLNATATETEISLVWDAITDADSYSLELDGTTVVNNITDTSCIVTGLTPDTQHSYRIKSVNAVGESEWSSPVSISTLSILPTLPIPLSTPVNLNATATETEISLVWDAIADADSYSLELDGTTVVNNITDTSYTVIGLTPSMQHSYRIKAVNDVGESEWSSPVSISTLLPIPQNLNFEISGPDTFTISWDAVNAADSYSLEVDGASVIDNITSTSYTIGNLMPGAHSFRIKAFSTLSESNWSSSISTKPAVPTNLTAEYNGNCVEIYWDPNPNPNITYVVEVDGDETWVDGTNFGFNNASYPGPYSIRVRAIGNWTASDWTEYVYVSVPTPNFP